MKPTEFFSKICSLYLWGNIAAFALVIVLLVVGTKFGIDLYTHHGESIVLPDVRRHSFDDANHVLDDLGFDVVVIDTGYIKTLPAGTVLEQSPTPGLKIKSGRIIYLTINSTSSPTLPLPDIIENCSYREAHAKLTTLGFKVGETQYMPGEKDWIYGVTYRGKNIKAGTRVAIDEPIILQVGNGLRYAGDSAVKVKPVVVRERRAAPVQEVSSEVDDFEEISE